MISNQIQPFSQITLCEMWTKWGFFLILTGFHLYNLAKVKGLRIVYESP